MKTWLRFAISNLLWTFFWWIRPPVSSEEVVLAPASVTKNSKQDMRAFFGLFWEKYHLWIKLLVVLLFACLLLFGPPFSEKQELDQFFKIPNWWSKFSIRPNELDQDGDGLNDNVDACPNELGVPEYNGCRPTNADKDDCLDHLDPCPNEAGPRSNCCCPSGKEE